MSVRLQNICAKQDTCKSPVCPCKDFQPIKEAQK